MKIIIAGDGEVGFYLAKLLEREFRDITLIDTQKDKLDYVERNLGIATVLGDSTSYRILKDAGVGLADLLIAVTSNESVNISTCTIGKKLGAKFTIARISNMEYLTEKEQLDLKEIGVDELISPESLAVREIKYRLNSPSLTETYDLNGGALSLMGLYLDDESLVINKTIDETKHLIPNNSFMVVCIYRKGKPLIPNGKTMLLKGDQLYFIATQSGKAKVLEYAHKKPIQIKKILIVGGSRTGIIAANRLSKYYEVTLIEKDAEKSQTLAKQIPKVQIVCGDGTDVKLLEDERIGDFDAIISVTGNSETNIICCLIARDAGVVKNIAMLENISLFGYSQKMGIDTLINKKLAAANFIFQKIHKAGIISYLYGVDAEIHEFIVSKSSKIAQKPINKLSFPPSAMICGVVRNGEGHITLGDFQVKENDKVFVLSLPESHGQISSYLK